MTPNLSVDDVLSTTRSVRKRLDFSRPVSRQVLLECLELAIQAPAASHATSGQWFFVGDPDKKKALGDIYRTNFDAYQQSPKPKRAEEDSPTEHHDRAVTSAQYLAAHIHEAPWLLVPCLGGRVDETPQLAPSFWGSLLPAVWSYMLALRSRGLGSAYTTLHLLNDGEKQAAGVLGIPHANYTQAGLFPIAYTKGSNFRPARRPRPDQIAHWDRW
jgi:nitroreductase